MLTETFEAPVILETFDAGSPHLARIRGRFIREGARSTNKRIYENTQAWLERAQTRIASGSVVDMRSHHGAGDKSTEIVGKVTRVNPDGTYESVIANTANGREVLPLIRGGYLKHVSLRGARAVTSPVESESGWTRITDLDLQGVDFTNTPGIAEASVVAESAGDDGVIVESAGLEATVEYWERDFTADERKKAAGEGAALPDGSFPIYTAKDLHNAISTIGLAKDPAAAKAHIITRAKALGATDALPDSWNVKESQGDDMTPKNEEKTTNAISGIIEAHITGAGLPGADATPEQLQVFVAEKFTAAATKAREITDATEGATSVADVLELAVKAAQFAAPATLESLVTDLTVTEAGKSISAANMAKLQAAHDMIVGASGITCNNAGQDGDGDEKAENGKTKTVAETDLSTQITEAVMAAAATLEKEFETKLTEQREAHEAQIAEIKSARRKSHAVLENASKEQLAKPASLEDALRAVLADRGVRLK